MSAEFKSPGASLVGCLLLSEDGTIRAANETGLNWMGYSPDEVVGRPLHAFLAAGGQYFLQSQIFPLLKLKGRLEEIYLRIKLKGGGEVPVLINTARLTGGEELVIEFSFIRIPQRGHLEDELLKAKKLAEQANDSKTKFLGMMSHELRTPLGAISLSHQMLAAGEVGPLTAEQQELIAGSESSVRSVTLLIEDILNFAKMQGGPVQVSLQDLPVVAAVARAELAIRHRFQHAGLSCNLNPIDPKLIARYDPDRVQQILLNLLNNALKFTPIGGSVSISAREEADQIAIAVSDTGCGIPADQSARIFEPFVQLRTAVQTTEKTGVGLGLAICRDLAIAMGGSIQVASALGKGSTFELVLPRASS